MDLISYSTDTEIIQQANISVPVNAADFRGDDELFKGYSVDLLNFASITCMVFMAVGIPGNLITIIALARCKKLRNATAVFIINLSCSDLLFCCFNLPLSSSTFWNRKWIHGDLLCRLFPLLRYGLVAVSLFNILAITINRYIMIGHPRIYQRVYKRKYIFVMVIASWLLGFGFLIPTWFNAWGKFGLDSDIGSCTIKLDGNHHSPKEFLFIIAFALPCLCIVICYARIFYIVRKTALKTQEPLSNNNYTESTRALNEAKKRRESIAQANMAIENEFTSSSKEKEAVEVEEKPIEDNVENKTKERRLSFNIGLENSERFTSGPITLEIQNENDSLVDDEAKPKIIANDNKLRFSQQNIDELRYIDTSFESDLPPTLSELKHYKIEKCTTLIINITSDIVQPNEANGDLIKDESIVNKEPIPAPVIQNVEHTESVLKDVDEKQMLNGNSTSTSPRKKRRSIVKRLGQSTLIRKSRSNRSLHHKNTSGASIMYPGRMTTKDRRLLKMILVIFTAFVICYLPITLFKIFVALTANSVLNIIGYILIYLTTCINPFIYVVMSYEYRQAYWNLLMCRTNSNRQNKDLHHRGSRT